MLEKLSAALRAPKSCHLALHQQCFAKPWLMSQIPVWEQTHEKMLTTGCGGRQHTCHRGRQEEQELKVIFSYVRVQAQPGLWTA